MLFWQPSTPWFFTVTWLFSERVYYCNCNREQQ